MNNLSKNIRFISQERQISLREIAKELNITRQNLNNQLSRNNMKLDTAIKICNILNITLDDLVRNDLTSL